MIQPFQQRVIDEKSELDTKHENLSAFLAGSLDGPLGTIPEAERERLQRQAGIMAQYREVLAERIAAFNP